MNGPIFKSLLVFMLPILVSCLFQQLYNTVDTMIVGNVLGDTALAAIGACGAIYELLVGFGIGIGNGLAIVAARAYGAGDEDQLKQTVAGSIVIGIIASAVITLAGAAGLYPLLELLDTPAEILEDAYGYIIIIDLGVIVMFAYNLCAGLLRAIGNSFHCRWSSSSSRRCSTSSSTSGSSPCWAWAWPVPVWRRSSLRACRWRSASCMSSAAPGCSCPGKSTSMWRAASIGSCSARASPWAS